MHNKEYELKLVQDKINGNNDYSYSQILNKKDINSILVHGLTNKPSNNSPFTKEIEFIKNFKNKYPTIGIQQFIDIYHENIIFNIK